MSAIPEHTRPGRGWFLRALCKNDLHPDQFFVSDKPAYAAVIATRYCNGCPVRAECLDYALDTSSVGIWAGLSTEQRKAIRRKWWRVTRTTA